jgi:hypothetical protein
MWTKDSTLAELASEGYDQLEIACGYPCGITIVTFDELASRWRHDWSLADIAKRLRCRRCGKRATLEQVKPDRQNDAPGMTQF